jgi:serine/threonine-protein kinase RsbT
MSGDSPAAPLLVRIDDESDLPVMLVRLGAWLRERGIPADEVARISTAASELGSNIVKYAQRGTLRIAILSKGSHRGVELEAEDRGPGIGDVSLALSDRYSTAGSLGLGLPGVRRLMDDFDLRSRPGVGTTVRARRWLT